MVERNIVLKYCKSDEMIADMLTKGICKIHYAKFRSMSEEEC